MKKIPFNIFLGVIAIFCLTMSIVFLYNGMIYLIPSIKDSFFPEMIKEILIQDFIYGFFGVISFIFCIIILVKNNIKDIQGYMQKKQMKQAEKAEIIKQKQIASTKRCIEELQEELDKLKKE